MWFEPGLVLEMLSAELTLSPNDTAGWGQLKDDAGLAMRFPRFTGRWRDDKAAGRDHHSAARRALSHCTPGACDLRGRLPMETEVPKTLWTPDPATARASAMAQFARFVREQGLADVDELDYPSLHSWSVDDLDGFWAAAAEFLGVRFHAAPQATLGSRAMPGTEWFPGGTLNYAEHALSDGPGRAGEHLAVIFVREDGLERQVSHAELRDLVARVRTGLRRLGVRDGDRVVALMPNCVETLAAFLAVASLGAIWSSCSPDFGTRAVVTGSPVGAVSIPCRGWIPVRRERFDVRDDETLREQLPRSRDHRVAVPGGCPVARNRAVGGADGRARSVGVRGRSGRSSAVGAVFVRHDRAAEGIVQVTAASSSSISRPLLCITTLDPGERFFWFTTTGWMMWNLLISACSLGRRLCCTTATLDTRIFSLWRLAEKHRVSYFGVRRPTFTRVGRPGWSAEELELSQMRRWVQPGAAVRRRLSLGRRQVGREIQICSMSGGTDLCTAFLESAPTVPVWLGEFRAPRWAHRRRVRRQRRRVIDEVGELVLTKPMPSMPVSFWRILTARGSYGLLRRLPGVWRHGDWVRRHSVDHLSSTDAATRPSTVGECGWERPTSIRG